MPWPVAGVVLGGKRGNQRGPLRIALPTRGCVEKVIAIVDDAVGRVGHAALELYVDSVDPGHLVNGFEVPNVREALPYLVKKPAERLFFV
jgi:hypothetical protein